MYKITKLRNVLIQQGVPQRGFLEVLLFLKRRLGKTTLRFTGWAGGWRRHSFLIRTTKFTGPTFETFKMDDTVQEYYTTDESYLKRLQLLFD